MLLCSLALTQTHTHSLPLSLSHSRFERFAESIKQAYLPGVIFIKAMLKHVFRRGNEIMFGIRWENGVASVVIG